MNKYYISFVFFKNHEWNYGSTYAEADALNEESVTELEKDLCKQLEVKSVIFLLMRQMES